MVSPAFKTLFDAEPVTLPVTLPLNAAVMVPALKLPEASRATIASAVFALVAVVAKFETLSYS
jgi:hypothetical protein